MDQLFDYLKCLNLPGQPGDDLTKKFVTLLCDRRALPYPASLTTLLSLLQDALKDIKKQEFGPDQWDDQLTKEDVVDLLLELKTMCTFLAEQGPYIVRPAAVSLIGLVLHHSTVALATPGS